MEHMPSKNKTVVLSKDELTMIAYALKEQGYHRLEQATEHESTCLRLEAQKHFDLAERFTSLAR
jgi:hypothetical protein